MVKSPKIEHPTVIKITAHDHSVMVDNVLTVKDKPATAKV